MRVVAGVVVETVPGAQARVAVRLARLPGLSLAGGDGARRIAAVWEADGGETLEEFAERLLREEEEVLGVFPTFVGADDDGPGARSRQVTELTAPPPASARRSRR